MKTPVLCAMAAAMIVGSAALVAAPAPANAAPSCGDRAKWMFPYDKRARKAFRQDCKDRRAAWKDGRKAWKKARKRGVWIGY
ncbi:MAG: hypothetical protein QNJ62_11045 [Methyloceanibacter sp.]|nr:hypothetical protein [Methyloceanibacter sp.]